MTVEQLVAGATTRDSPAPTGRFPTLEQWLRWQEGLHPNPIDLGLERVATVWRRLHVEPPPFAVITVGGTNGKGSCVAMAEAILAAAGYRVGAYTSPHLLRYNERVRVAGGPVGDDELCESFARIDAARGETSLTYFEFGTLAALDIFYRAQLDVAILEVGMGGRLDAVNILDPDVALVTTVDIDHSAWLGDDREAIGREKAGIFRGGRPAVYGDTDPPRSLVEHARAIGAELYLAGRDYHAESDAAGWRWEGGARTRYALPYPRLRGAYQRKNAAAVVMALDSLAARLPVGQQALRLGLMTADVPGRFHVLDGQGLRICDVAHNPQAARSLAGQLATLPRAGRTHAVVAMLADKDQTAVIEAMAGAVDHWHVAGLSVARGATAAALAVVARAVAGATAVSEYAEVAAALAGARAAAADGERIVVFGSFYTVAEALSPERRAWWDPARAAAPKQQAG